MVYVTKKAGQAETVAQLKTLFGGLEGVARIVSPAEYGPLGYPDPGKNPRMADLVLAAADGYAFHGAPDGEAVAAVPAGATPGTHGYLNTEADMTAIFVASGAGIRSGVKLGRMRNIDVAPTIARLLGLTLPHPEGSALVSILK